MHAGADSRLDALVATCSRALAYSSGAVCGFWVPGRIEVLGKHTDYAGGRSLLAAVDRGFCILAAARDDERIALINADTSQRVDFPFSEHIQAESGGWTNYSMTVARRLARNFPRQWKGAEIAFASTLPPAAGLSSSTALLIGTFLALATVNDLFSDESYRRNIEDNEQLAGYLAAVESGRTYGTLAGDAGVGTQGGSQDHVAILCCRADELAQYSFNPVRFERAVAMPEGHVFVVGSSGVRAEKAGAARERYNRAASLTRQMADIARNELGWDGTSLGAMIAAAPDGAQRLRRLVQTSDELTARLDQFVAETFEIIPAAVEALATGHLDEFGALVDRSQMFAEKKLGNQVEETSYLAASARRHGAVAASAFGAGFGGSVWAMIGADDAPRFLTVWRKDYQERFPQHADQSEFFVSGAGSAARRIQ